MVALPEGSVTIGTGLKVKGKKLTSPLTFTRGARLLTLNGKLYRGKLVVYLRGGRLTVVNRVGIDDYIKGVVPDEMPPSWSPEALKAQAVAARSYAVATRKTGGIFDLYPDTRSQVYGGVSSEEPSTNTADRGDREADPQVQGQRRDDVLPLDLGREDRGDPGRLELDRRALPRLGSGQVRRDVAAPQLGPVPLHGGGVQARARRRRRRRAAWSTRRSCATRPRASTTSRCAAPASNTSISGTGFQSAFGLRSSWFSISVLSLTGGSAPKGKRIALNGLARGFKDVWLERRVDDDWVKVRDLKPGDDGRFTTKVRPGKTSWFRIAAPKGAGAPVRVTVTVRRAAAVLAGLAAAALLAAPAGAARGQLSVAVADGADAAAVQRAVASATGGRLVADLGAARHARLLGATTSAPPRRGPRGLRGVGSVERLGGDPVDLVLVERSAAGRSSGT